MCVVVYVWILICVGVCKFGFCDVWVCVCLDFVMSLCVCVDFVMRGCVYVCIFYVC